MKVRWFSLLMCLALVSCDFFESGEFVVVNESATELVIRTIREKHENGLTFRDSVHSIPPGERLVFYQSLGTCARDYVPPDYYEWDEQIPPVSRFAIFVSGKEYDTLRLRHFWDHSSRRQVGIYTLRITDELLEGL